MVGKKDSDAGMASNLSLNLKLNSNISTIKRELFIGVT